jgi:cyclic pyranopterin phosphate synthase
MARMIDVGDKKLVKRTATATGSLHVDRSTAEQVLRGRIKKGDVLTVSKLAGIQAAKSTSQLLPLCHQIPLTSVEVDMQVGGSSILATCTVSATYRTGVEMEALVGVTAALLNAWDMVKYLEKDSKGQYPLTVITDIRVTEKKKGGGTRGRR